MVFALVAASTPKSHTKRFIPSGRISASAYSPGGRGSLTVKRKTVGATSQRWIEIVLRFSSNCCPNRLLIDSSSRLLPCAEDHTSPTSAPDAPGRLLLEIAVDCPRSGE